MTKSASKIKPIRKVLIANRGEIAVRVIRCLREMNIVSVAVYSEADRTAAHVRLADEAYLIGPAPSAESYLRMDKVIAAALQSAAEAIHPGYGFLAENAEFARACQRAGLIFIGPRPETIEKLGDKIQARNMAVRAGLKVAPAVESDLSDWPAVKKQVKEFGYPALVKAAAGGGGKGMRVVDSESELEEAVEIARREARSAFADDRVFIEKYLERPRHIEIQILGDEHGEVVSLGERECSIQRRHQKIIEEAPSSFVNEDLRQRMGEAAVAIGRESGYVGAGTVEFLVDSEANFYFLEVNTRLQVEHPVTEMVTGIDIVREQIAVAEGRPLSFSQDDISIRGWAIESRICAEDPASDFLPSTGFLDSYRQPAGPGVRVDAGVFLGSEVSVHYDPLIAKLIVWGRDRNEAIDRSLRALAEYRISGVASTIGFAREALDSQAFRSGDLSTSFVKDHFPEGVGAEQDQTRLELAAIAAAVAEYRSAEKVVFSSQSANATSSAWKLRGRERALRRR